MKKPPGDLNYWFLNVFSEIGVYARPHPGPLPRGEGSTSHVAGQFLAPHCNYDSLSLALRRTIIRNVTWLKTRRIILPLLGRGGARADVITSDVGSCFFNGCQNGFLPPLFCFSQGHATATAHAGHALSGRHAHRQPRGHHPARIARLEGMRRGRRRGHAPLGQLLKHFGISKPLLSYFQFNEARRSEEIIERLRRGEKWRWSRTRAVPASAIRASAW